MNTVAAMAKDPDAPLRPGDDVDAARWARLSELDAMGGRRARACGRHCWGRKGREGLPFLAFVRTWPLQEAGDVAHFFAHCGSTRPPTSHYKHPPPTPTPCSQTRSSSTARASRARPRRASTCPVWSNVDAIGRRARDGGRSDCARARALDRAIRRQALLAGSSKLPLFVAS